MSGKFNEQMRTFSANKWINQWHPAGFPTKCVSNFFKIPNVNWICKEFSGILGEFVRKFGENSTNFIKFLINLLTISRKFDSVICLEFYFLNQFNCIFLNLHYFKDNYENFIALKLNMRKAGISF